MNTDDFDIMSPMLLERFPNALYSTAKLQKLKLKKVNKFYFPLPSIGTWEYIIIQRLNYKFLVVSLINDNASPK